MPSSLPRSVEYVAFVEIVHGRWVRLKVNAASPPGALAEVRKKKLDGKTVVARKNNTYEYEERIQ